MSLLTAVQTAAPRFGLPVPAIAASSTDQNIQQLVAFANEEGQELLASHPWQDCRFETSFATVSGADQGDIRTMCTAVNPLYPFDFIINETIWNRTQRRPIFGPKSPAEWQQLLAQFVQGPWYQYVIRGNHILFTPTPSPTGDSCFFEYMTNVWCTNAAGTATQTSFLADTDVSLISERLITLGMIWRFQQAKGLDFSASFQKYENAKLDLMSRDGGKKVLNMNGSQTEVWPGAWVPAGNWHGH